MTTDIRETLHDIGTSVTPPVVDRVAFEARVRRARRQRRTGQVAVAAASAVAVGVTAWLVAPGGGGEQPDVADDPSTGGVPSTSPEVLAFAEQGRLFLSNPDDPSREVDTGIAVEEVVARVFDGVVYVDRESHLKHVRLRIDGTTGAPTDVAGPDPVQWSSVDAGDTTLWFVDLDDVLHRRVLGSDADLATVPLESGSTVVAVGAEAWVESGVDSLQLHTGDASHDVQPYFPAMDVDLAGSTMTVVTEDGTEIWSATTGKRVHGSLGGSTAALSPDGRWVASGPDEGNLDLGMSHGLWLTDTRTGQVREVPFDDDTGPVHDIWWEDDDRYFVVVATNAAGQPIHTLYECTLEGGCRFRIEDETGTLQLPRD